MNEHSPLPQWAADVIQWIAATLIGFIIVIIGWIFDVYRRKIDTLEKYHADLPKAYVPRDELMQRLDSMSDDRWRMHEENREKNEAQHQEYMKNLSNIRDDIREDLRSVHDRIDEILRK